MNIKTKPGRWHTKLLASLLCVLVLAGLFPVSAFAWPSGTAVSSWYGDNIVSADGGTYSHPASWSVIIYGADGTQTAKTIKGGGAYRHFTLTDSGGETRWVYCIEAGMNFTASDAAYTVDSGYLGRLPATAQNGIKLASLYGWQPGAALPVGGINANDYYMATQAVLWEYQQQLRSDAHSRHGNGVADANQFYNIIAGRPAEAAYNWILGKVASHATLPSFTGGSASSAPTHELKWDTKDKVYRLTLTDTNNLGVDLQRLAGSGVTVTRSGNRYTFTSSKMIMDPVLFQYRKNVPTAGAIIVWGRPSYQTMMTGSEDPVTFFMKIKTETYGWARLIKTSEDGIVSGIKFNISGTDILGGKVNTDVTTGANGRVDAKLLPGTYLVKEYPIDRYVTPPPQYVTIESGQVSEVHFSNILKKFRVLLTKSDADTGFVQGNASLAGAVYGLFKGDQLMDTYTTDANGQFLTRYYVCDTDWTIKELAPSTGYLLDTTVHPVGADPRLYEVEHNTTENHVTEKVKYGRVQLIKHTDEWDPDVPEEERDETGTTGIIEQPEAGAVFELYLRSAASYAAARPTERDILTTNADGIAASKLLPYGYYTVHQTAGAEGKAFVSDFTVFVSVDGFTYSYILNNTTITGRLRVEKHDAETGLFIPMAGVGYKVKDLATGEFVTQRVWYPNPVDLDTFYTSDEGWLMLPEVLPANGAGYELHEVQAPEGYVLNPEPIPFVIDGSEAVVTVVQNNTAQKARLTITKTGEVFSSVAENLGPDDSENIYQPVYEVMGLPGATFDIIADEDITTGDGTLRAAKDTVVETITTGEDATATTGLLYLGRYRVEERESPYGMVLGTEPHYIEFTYAGQDVEIVEAGLSVYDERQKVAIDLVKALETDALFGVGLGDEYMGLSFGLYAAEDIPALDGAVIPAGGLIEVVSVEPVQADAETPEDVQQPETPAEDGTPAADEPPAKTYAICGSAFLSDLPFGSYYVQERTTDRQYILNDTKYPVVFGYEGQDVAVVSITANDGAPIENNLIRGDVEGLKLDEDDSAPAEEPDPGYDGEQAEPAEDAEPDVPDAGDAEDGGDDAEPQPETGSRRGLAGAVIGLFHPDDEEMTKDTAILLTTSAEDGSFSFRQIPFGHWVIKEVEQPEGYILSSEFHHVYIGVDGQLITIRIENTKIRGNVQLVKVDAADPCIKLPGAVFALYEDTNQNGEFDEGDTLLGTLDEPDGGIHEWRSLLYGGYFVVEQSPPEGFLPDENAWYFEIRTDGETILIENGEPGKGFANVADGGTGRIIKDSEDGRRYGFSFKIEGTVDGEAYSETFTTGADGIIAVGLKPGTYTISEVKDEASAGYVLPEPATVEIKQGETSIIQFYNALPDEPAPKEPEKPETPTPKTPSTPAQPQKPVPQTGDNYMALVWAGLIAAALVAGVVALLLYRKWAGKHSRRRTAAAISVLLCLLLVLGSGGMVLREFLQYQKDANAYEHLQAAALPNAQADAPGAEPDASDAPAVDFDTLRQINPDVAGWLSCEGTPINYPLVQGTDNSQYLRTLFDGGKGKAGCLFIDYENSPGFADKNTVVYGHNLLDGSMLSSIIEYGQQGYYETHPTMRLHTLQGSYTVELFAGYVARVNDDAWLLEWEDTASFGEWLETVQGKSAFESDVAVGASDKVLTLSTCTNGGRDRFVLHGKFVEDI